MPDLKKVHIGRNIERLRNIRGIKQETLASELGISQQAVSKMEQSEAVDKEKLEHVARILGVTKEAIENYTEEAAIFNFQNNSDTSSNNTIVNYQFNPVEKIAELYERLLKEKDGMIELLKQQQK